MVDNQELLKLVIILFILVTTMCNSGVILNGDIRRQSLLGVNLFILCTFSILFSIKFSEVPNKENLLYNQELWYLLIISVILVTLIYDLGMIL